MEHRATSVCLHLLRSLAHLLADSQVRLLDLSSSIVLHRHVCFGCLRFFFPCMHRFHSKAWRVTFNVSFLRMCPIHCHFLLRIGIFIGFWLVLFHSSEFGTLLVHLNLRSCYRHLLRKVWTFFVLCLATFQNHLVG